MKLIGIFLVFILLLSSGCGFIAGTALTHDEYFVICTTGFKQGLIAGYIVPHNYPMAPDMLPKCETGTP